MLTYGLASTALAITYGKLHELMSSMTSSSPKTMETSIAMNSQRIKRMKFKL